MGRTHLRSTPRVWRRVHLPCIRTPQTPALLVTLVVPHAVGVEVPTVTPVTPGHTCTTPPAWRTVPCPHTLMTQLQPARLATAAVADARDPVLPSVRVAPGPATCWGRHGLVWCATQVVVSAMGVATVAVHLVQPVTYSRVVVYPKVGMDGMGTTLLGRVCGVIPAVGHAVVETSRIAGLVLGRI